MSNSIYNIARYLFATAGLNWNTQKLVLIAFNGPPTFVETDATIAAIIARGTTIAVGHALPIAGKSVTTDGYLQTDTIVIPGVAVGPDVTHFIMASYISTWNDDKPLLYVDDALNLPFTPNGLDIVVTPDWLQKRGWGRV